MIGFQATRTATSISAGASHFIMPFASSVEDDNSVASTQRPVPAGTLDRLGVYVTANTITAQSDLVAEVDDVDSSLSVAITASTTGFFEDTSNTATPAANADITYRMDGGSTGTSMSYNRIRARFVADTNEVSLLGNNGTGSSNQSTNNNTSFMPFEGQRALLSDESLTQFEHLTAGTLGLLYVRLGTCTRTGDTVTGRSRVNGVNGNMSVSMTGDTSNTNYEDTSNTDTIAANDLVNYSTTTGANSGNFNYEKVCVAYTTTNDRYVQVVRSSSSSQRVNDNVTAWFPSGGQMGTEETGTESNVQMDLPEETTVRLLSVYLDRMTGTVSTTTTYRDDSAQAGSMSVALSATGYAEDTSNTAVVAAGSEVNVQVTSPVGGTNYDVNYIAWVGEIAAVGGGATPKGPLGHPLHGAFGGPI